MRQSGLIAFGIIIAVGFVFGCGQKHTEEELYKMAQEYENQSNIDDAVRTYEEQVDDYPDGKYADEAIQRIAFLYYNNIHEFNKAIEYHQRLIENYPESEFAAQARFMIGFIYANNLNDYDMAQHYYNEFLEKHPKSELVESVTWELEHLGEDVNTQLDELFGNEKSNGEATQQ